MIYRNMTRIYPQLKCLFNHSPFQNPIRQHLSFKVPQLLEFSMSRSLSSLFLKYGYQVCSWNSVCPLPNKLLIWLTHIRIPAPPRAPAVILSNGAPIFKPVQRMLCPPATNLRLPLRLFFKHLVSAWKVEHWQSAFPPNVICVIRENLASNADRHSG